MEIFSLNNLKCGDSAYIYSINTTDEIKNRLEEFGFFPNNKISPAFKSPFRCLTAYRIIDSLIAIRDDIADNIIVTKLTEVK